MDKSLKARLYTPLDSSAMQRFVRSPSHHLRKVLKDILDNAMKPVGVQHGWIALIDPASKSLHIVAHQGVAREYQKKRLKIGEGVTGWVTMEGKLLNIPDVSKEPRYFNLIGSTRSEICVPLLSKTRILGVLNLESDVLGAFKAKEETLVLALADQAAIAVETAFWLESTSLGLDRLEKLQNMSNAISKHISEPKLLLDMIIHNICELTGADCAVIYPYDYIKKDFYDIEYVAHYGNRFPIKLADKPRTKGLAAQISDIKWLVREKILDEPTLINSPFISREKIKAFIGVCLEVGTDIVGILYVSYRKPHQFNELEETLVKTLANQAAIAIYNSRRFERTNEELARSFTELQSLQRIDNVISSTLDLTEVLNRILKEGMKIVNAPTGTIQFLDSDTGELMFKAGHGMDKNGMERRIKLNEGITGRVAAENKSLLISDLKNYSGSFVPVMHDESRSELAVPIFLSDRVIGVLNVESPLPNHFSEHDLRLFKALAGQSAIAIQNAQRYEAIQMAYKEINKERRRFEALATINRVIGGMQSVDEVIQALLRVMGDVLVVENRSILLYDSTKDVLVVNPSAYYQIDPDKRSQTTIKVGTDSEPGLTAWAARHSVSIRVDDVRKDSRYFNLISNTLSEMAVPMMLGNRVIGVLNLESNEVAYFTDDDQRLVEAIAGEMVIAIEKAEQNELIIQQQRQAAIQKKWGQIGELASTLTHRIGNEIGIIRVRANNIKLIPGLDSDIQKQVQIIITHADGLIKLTSQFFGQGLSRVFADNQRTSRTEINKVIAAAVERSHEVGNRILSLKLCSESLFIIADNRLLEELFRELIANAVRATPEDGYIEVGSLRNEKMAEVWVADTGKGIPSDYATTIWKPFQKIDGEGHGFGLWWARGFVEDLGGSINHHANDQHGKGTIFIVTLPIDQSSLT